jgi:valyl-tRNA synthetase
MPFLTEELWQRIPRRQGDSTQTVSLAQYPVYDDSMNDATAEANYELILDVCRANRSLIAAYPTSAGAQLYCQLYDDSNFAVAKEHLGSIRSLSGKGIGTIDLLSKE